MDAQRYAGAQALVRRWLPQLTVEQCAGLRALLDGYVSPPGAISCSPLGVRTCGEQVFHKSG